MKTFTPKFLKLLFTLLFLVTGSTVSFAQQAISVYYPGSPDPIVFGSTIVVSSSEVVISIKNTPLNTGNPSMTLNSDTWLQFSNANIGLKPNSINTNASLSSGSYNLKKNEYFNFTLQKLNNVCGTFATKVTITSNAANKGNSTIIERHSSTLSLRKSISNNIFKR